MQIKQANIYGFGRWVNQTIDFDEKFNCIFGLNESGKSTIHQFILYVLFGMTKRELEVYQPKMANQFGGRIVLTDSVNGTYTVERITNIHNGKAIVYLRDGTTRDEAWLKEQLHGMTKQIYQGIFSFSAIELSREKDLSEEELSELILSIGLTGASDIRKVETSLDQEIGDLFKRLGRVPKMNKQIQQLENLQAQLLESERNEHKYKAEVSGSEKVKRHMNKLRIEMDQLKQSLQLLERQKFVMPLIHDYVQLEQNLQHIPQGVHFPENGEERLEKIQTAILQVESEEKVLQEEHEVAKSRLDLLIGKERDPSLITNITTILNNQYAYDEKRRQYEELINAIELERKDVRQSLNELAIGLETEDVRQLEFPFHLQKQWEDIRLLDEEQKRYEVNLSEEKLRLEREYEHYELDLKDLESHMLTDDEVIELEKQVKILREEEIIEKAKLNVELSRRNWYKQRDKKRKKAKKLRVSAFLAALGVSILAFYIYTPLFILGPIFALIGILQYSYAEKSIKETDALFGEETSSEQQAPTETDQGHYEKLLEEHKHHLSERDVLYARMKEIDIQFIQLEEKRSSQMRQRMRTDEQIRKQIELYRFLENLEPKYWTELLFTLKRLKEKITNFDRKMYQVNELNEWLIQFENQVVTAAQELSLEDELEVSAILEELNSIVTSDEANKKEIAYHKNQKDLLEQKLHLLKQKIKPYKDERSSLFNEADVDNQSDFYSRGKLVQRKHAYLEQKEQISHRLDELFKRDEWLQFIHDEKIDSQFIELEIEKKLETLKEFDTTLTNMQQELADYTARKAALELSETYSELRYLLENEIESFNRNAREWMVLKTARELLATTKRRYRDKYLKEVIKMTEKYFNRLTNGKYVHIFAPTVGNRLQVESEDGLRYAMTELSQGTLDCLYVSLRLATSKAMAKEHRLPFIIDDAFVHFDYKRTIRILDILREIGQEHQVIFFTCKNEMIEITENERMIKL